jgi:hypothetical protein
VTLFDVNTDPFDPEPDYVRVRDTHIGKAVFSVRRYPASAVIGEISGELSYRSATDEYTFDFDDELQLDPEAPFRFVNHSCNPNCEFDMCDQGATDEQPATSGLYLVSLRTIEPDEPLTIDYNWPAKFAIPCECRDPGCRGWVVSKEELANVVNR